MKFNDNPIGFIAINDEKNHLLYVNKIVGINISLRKFHDNPRS
tara:strand:- start:1116 stop:1244 length:129 start_codon:yes stop_codon:yes gene_type:complete